MANWCDYVVKFNSQTDTTEDITRRILYNLIIRNRLKRQKPSVWFQYGGSGEGKSYSMLKIQEVLLEAQGLKLSDYIDDINVYLPTEYPTKLKHLLYDKRLKKVNLICVHEARVLIKAKLWHNFVNLAIPDINAMSRKIKPLAIFIISQSFSDIVKDIRRTVNFYVKASRPSGRKARLYINVLWENDYDVENLRLGKRRLQGYLVNERGKYFKHRPEYLELTLPDKEVITKFDHGDLEGKKTILNKKIHDVVAEMQETEGLTDKKVNLLTDYYVRNRELLVTVGKRVKNKFKLKAEVRELHNLTVEESVQLEESINEKLSTVQTDE